jgi:bifunctional non-homologous end joining protein LigD
MTTEQTPAVRGPQPGSLPTARELAGARRAGLPAFVEPQLATLVSAPPAMGYVHEMKLDGYRVLARLQRGKVRLLTRRGHDWSARFPALRRVFEALPLDSALFDGEVVVLSASGATDFQRLQNSLSAGRDEACIYYAFDLLYLLGRDLRELPLLERKRLLERTLTAVEARRGRIRYSAHDAGDGAAFLEQACRMKLEGMVSKRADAAYSSGRGRAWLKLKCQARQEFVIAGFTEPGGARSHFGALLLGEHDAAGRLQYAGRVGTGFSVRSLTELAERLRKLEQPASPFATPLPRAEARGVHWLQPKLVAEVTFAERTRDGRVRHPSFLGLREDKRAREIRAEVPAEASRSDDIEGPLARVRVTHPERVLYEDEGITKRDLAEYYAAVAPWMLPHLARRPLTLLRCPQGQGKDCFFQRHPRLGVPDSVKRLRLTERGKRVESMFVEDVEGLLGLVQAGALEVHTWGSRCGRLEHPDQLVFDLDQAEDVAWPAVVEAALALRAQLEALGLRAFVKTTGGKGLHVVAPINPRLDWQRAREFSRLLVLGLMRAEPDRYVVTASKAKRKGKIYLDYLRNARGATAVCAYSTRARPGAPVSMPLDWDELTPELRADRFTLRNVPKHLARRRADPWRDFDAARVTLNAAARRSVGMPR